MWIRHKFALVVVAFLFTFCFFQNTPTVYAARYCKSGGYCTGMISGVSTTLAHCLSFQHYQPGVGYIYNRYDCKVTKNIFPCSSSECYPSDSYEPEFVSSQTSAIPLDTSYKSDVGAWDFDQCLNVAHCGQGFNTQEDCYDYIGNPSCSGVPCACRPNNSYGGHCSYACSGGGGGPPPSPTPTPTPTPFCRVFCPGQASYMGGMDLNGGGVPQISVQPTPILPTQASGFINFFGYNGFQCGAFDDAKGTVIACPTPLGGGGGLGNYGLTSQFIYPTPTTVPLRYNMLCGNNTHIYTAVATSGGVSGSGGGVIGGLPGTPTPGPTSRPGLYPPNCNLGGPTPTPNPLLPGDQQLGGAKLGGGGLVGGAASCSCSVAVGCQTSLQSLPSTLGVGCGATCDFTVSPETPEFGDVTTFTPSGSGVDGSASFSFDDNTNPSNAGSGAVTHTFANSGVYQVALSCPSAGATCTRTVNNYCGPLSWYKLKNASFHKNGTLNDPIPTGVQRYDTDDTTESLVSIGNPGLVTTNGSITTGAGNLSTPNWRTTVYTPNTTYSPTAFADYVVARKSYSTVVDANSNGVIDSTELTANATNYIVGNYTIDNNNIQGASPLVLVVRGNLIINVAGNEFNPPTNNTVTIVVTGTLRIHSHIDTLNGIFIATSADLAYDVNSGTLPLKVIGNLISQNSIDLKKRIRTDGSKPSLFVVQDYKQYLNVLSKLGVSKYTQTELRP